MNAADARREAEIKGGSTDIARARILIQKAVTDGKLRVEIPGKIISYAETTLSHDGYRVSGFTIGGSGATTISW